MTATVEVSITLSCDAPGCKNTLPGPSDYSVTEVRKIAALLGWTYVPAYMWHSSQGPHVEQEADYCRAHTPLSRRSPTTRHPAQ